MNSSQVKVAAVAVALIGTWGSAHAASLTTTVAPTADLENLQLFTSAYNDPGMNPGASSLIDGSTELSSGFQQVGVGGGFTKTSTIAYSEGTSTYAGVFATSGDSIILGGSLYNATLTDYLSDVDQFSAIYNAIKSGSVATISTLTSGQGNGTFVAPTPTYGFFLTDLNGIEPTGSFTLYRFSNSSGTLTESEAGGGTFSVQAVPEPTSMAALGFGALALLRKRRK